MQEEDGTARETEKSERKDKEVGAEMLMRRSLRSLCTTREHSCLCRALLHQPPAATANGEPAVPRMRTAAALLTCWLQIPMIPSIIAPFAGGHGAPGFPSFGTIHSFYIGF